MRVLLYIIVFVLCCSESMSKPISIPPGIDYSVYTFDKTSLGVHEIEQQKGFIQIPAEKNIVVSFYNVNMNNYKHYSVLIKEIASHYPNVYIALSVRSLNLFSKLNLQHPDVKNLSLTVIVEDKIQPKFSTFNKLFRLRIVILNKGNKKVNRYDNLLLYDLTKVEQDYINKLLMRAVNQTHIKELSISARYYNIDLSEIKNIHLKTLSIVAGKLRLPNKFLNIRELSVFSMEILNVEKTFKSFTYLEKLFFCTEDLPDVLHFSDFPIMTNLNLSFNDFSVVKFGHMPNLETLKMTNCINLKEIHGLTHLKNMKSIDISSCINIENLNFLPLGSPITTLNLANCNKIDNFKILSKLNKLRLLNILYTFPENIVDNVIKKNIKPNCKIISDFELAPIE